MIITSPLNAPDTLVLLDQLTTYHHSKILIIDIIGTIFNKQNDFYKSITRNKDKWLTNNLLVLTTLTDKLKRFLNATFTTEYKNIYGKRETTSTTTTSTTTTTINPLTTTILASLMTDETISNASVADGISIDANDERYHEQNIISLLLNRTAKNGGGADTGASNFAHSFNEIQLHAISQMFRRKFFNENCSTHDDASTTNHSTKLPNGNERTSTKAPPTSSDTKPSRVCSSNPRSLMKCETYLRAAMKKVMSTSLITPSTPTSSSSSTTTSKVNVTILCEQIARHVRQFNDDNNYYRNSGGGGGGGGVRTGANQQNVSHEFIHLIPNQNDTKFSEYFTFFDFIVTKLAKTNNLSVNYTTTTPPSTPATATMTSIRSNDGTVPTLHAASAVSGSGTVSGTGDIFDFCVLDFHVSRFVVNQTTVTTAFVWRPFLILRQSEINQNLYITHPLIVGYHNWFFDGSNRFWRCGLLCWILAGILLLLLICILVAGVTFGLAIR